MSYQLAIDARNGIGTVTFEGEVRARDLILAIEALHEHPDWRPEFHEVWDGTGVRSVDMPLDDLKQVASSGASERRRGVAGGGRVALVVCKETYHTLARLYAFWMRRQGYEMDVFDAMDSARAWVVAYPQRRKVA